LRLRACRACADCEENEDAASEAVHRRDLQSRIFRTSPSYR
jgi:hypothetical protein